MILLMLFILGIMFVPPIAFVLAGLRLRKDKPERAKVFYILGAVYLVIGLGTCLSIISGV